MTWGGWRMTHYLVFRLREWWVWVAVVLSDDFKCLSPNDSLSLPKLFLLITYMTFTCASSALQLYLNPLAPSTPARFLVGSSWLWSCQFCNCEQHLKWKDKWFWTLQCCCDESGHQRNIVGGCFYPNKCILELIYSSLLLVCTIRINWKKNSATAN